MTREDIDISRMIACWELGEQYDDGEPPWDFPDESATNDVGAGCALLVGRAILVERQDGSKVAFSWTTEEEAHAEWPRFVREYGELDVDYGDISEDQSPEDIAEQVERATERAREQR